MTPIERALYTLHPLLGKRLAERIRSNLPSRKPQLWEHLPRALFRRAQIAWWAELDRRWLGRTTIVPLPEFDVLMEVALRNQDIDLALLQYGVYEISGTRFVESVLEPGMTVVDVGANGGYYSLIAARLVGSQGHVHAFEPAAGPFERLKRNRALNRFQNVTINRTAVAAIPGRSTMYPSAVESNDGLGSLLRGHDRLPVGEDVSVITLDHYVQTLPDKRIHLVKVDVEGSEAEVFTGAHTLLSGPDAPALLFESFDVGAITESLVRFGYEIRHVHYSLRNGLTFPELGEAFDNLFAAYEPPNYVALKRHGRFGSYDDISMRNRHSVSALLRFLAALA
jgi:FkbM family methyltransferase